MKRHQSRLREEGATIIEAALIIALIAVIAIPSLKTVSKKQSCKALMISAAMESGGGTGGHQELFHLLQQYGCSINEDPIPGGGG